MYPDCSSYYHSTMTDKISLFSVFCNTEELDMEEGLLYKRSNYKPTTSAVGSTASEFSCKDSSDVSLDSAELTPRVN